MGSHYVSIEVILCSRCRQPNNNGCPFLWAAEGEIWIKLRKTKPATGLCVIRYGLLFFVISIIGIIAIATGENDTPNNTSNEKSNSTEESTKKSTVKDDTPKVPAEFTSALSKATTYANTMNMSKQGVYDQLTSEHGEKFSKEAADYAIENVKADWNKNALAKAKTYQSDMAMSPNAIRDQLVSSYGEKFTEQEADYAMQNLDK